MFKRFLALACALVLAAPVALAADNLVGVQADSAKTTYRILTKEISPGLHVPAHWLVDQAGAAFGTSANPISVVLPSGQTVVLGTGSAVTVSNLPATQAVSAASLPLPTGAATAAGQTTGNSSLATMAAAGGGLTDTAWDGAAASASHTAILKAIVARLASPLAVDTVVRSTSADRGGVLTTANTAVTLVPANANRRGLAIQNRNAPGAYSSATSVFVNCLSTATADYRSLEVPAGALYETPVHHTGTGACSLISGTANTPVYIREF